MGPPIANSEPHLANSGACVFEKRSTGEGKAEGLALAIEDYCCFVPRRGSCQVARLKVSYHHSDRSGAARAPRVMSAALKNWFRSVRW
jgi:hypothetical protein